MSYSDVRKEGGKAIITLNRGKVNALNEPFVEELRACFQEIEGDPAVKTVILTGQGSFFSFGFDIPEFLDYSKEAFTGYLEKFTGLYTTIFTFPKPVIAALNGHTIAGGCMLATACDYRIMVSGKGKISLNEIGFGSSVLAGSVEMLKHCAGSRNAEMIFCAGAMYSAEEAQAMGLIDEVCSEEELSGAAIRVADGMAEKYGSAFTSIKRLLRNPVAEVMKTREKASILEFVDIWYSEETRRQLEAIKIR